MLWTKNPLEKHLGDLRFTIVAKVAEYSVGYAVYSLQRCGKDDICLWVHKDNCNQTTNLLEDAEVFLHGFVKWDGCSNWWFDIADDIAMHGCDRRDLTRVGEVLGICYDWTKELLPNFEG